MFPLEVTLSSAAERSHSLVYDQTAIDWIKGARNCICIKT